MYPIAPANSAIGSNAESRQDAVLRARPMYIEQWRQPKPADDVVIDRLLPQRR